MKIAFPSVLTRNGGSSSIRFTVSGAGATLRRRLADQIDRIGLRAAKLTASAGKYPLPRQRSAADHPTAAGFQRDWRERQPVP